MSTDYTVIELKLVTTAVADNHIKNTKQHTHTHTQTVEHTHTPVTHYHSLSEINSFQHFVFQILIFL